MADPPASAYAGVVKLVDTHGLGPSGDPALLLAPVAELAYACGLGPHPERVAGSNPARSTF